MKRAFFIMLTALLLASSLGACTTTAIVRGPMTVGADIGGLDGVVNKSAKP